MVSKNESPDTHLSILVGGFDRLLSPDVTGASADVRRVLVSIATYISLFCIIYSFHVLDIEMRF